MFTDAAGTPVTSGSGWSDSCWRGLLLAQAAAESYRELRAFAPVAE
jgi:hypothetical protein